jgi:hypothetical protein
LFWVYKTWPKNSQYISQLVSMNPQRKERRRRRTTTIECSTHILLLGPMEESPPDIERYVDMLTRTVGLNRKLFIF